MHETMTLSLGGEAVLLLADRALYWPARRRLFIADLHLGKADVFRAAGIALPRGGTAHDLQRLRVLVARTGAESLWILGDMLHGSLLDSGWRETWEEFRAQLAMLQIVVVAGNHDRALQRAGLDLTIETRDVLDPPFLLSHATVNFPGAFCISGHRHPVVRIPGFAGRYPCFEISPHGLILPAFSAFSGGYLLEQGSGWIACVEGYLLSCLAS